MTRYYILNYADYDPLPTKLFCGHTFGYERKNISETKFIVHCHLDDCPCMDYRVGNPTLYDDTTIHAAINTAEWGN